MEDARDVVDGPLNARRDKDDTRRRTAARALAQTRAPAQTRAKANSGAAARKSGPGAARGVDSTVMAAMAAMTRSTAMADMAAMAAMTRSTAMAAMAVITRSTQHEPRTGLGARPGATPGASHQQSAGHIFQRPFILLPLLPLLLPLLLLLLSKRVLNPTRAPARAIKGPGRPAHGKTIND